MSPFDEQTGTVTLSSFTPLGTNTYTVTATGTGNYQGTAEASISITVNKAALPSLNYSDIVATYTETAMSPLPRRFSDGSSPTATYTISTDDSNVSIDEQTGTVTLSSFTPLGTNTYTVTASGTGNYQGDTTASISITVNRAALPGLSYSNIVATYAETDSSAPSYSGGASPTATYTISPDDSYVSIDQQTGTVTLSSTTPSGTYPYTVTASGTGNYQGDTTASISITVNRAALPGLSYSNIVATYPSLLHPSQATAMDRPQRPPTQFPRTTAMSPSINKRERLP